MPRHIMPRRTTGTATRLRLATTRRRPHWDDTRSACCNLFPPLLATLVLIQSVARGGLKAALVLAILLALLGALSVALAWWPWARPEERIQPVASKQESDASPSLHVVPIEAPVQPCSPRHLASLRHHTPLEDWPWA